MRDGKEAGKGIEAGRRRVDCRIGPKACGIAAYREASRRDGNADVEKTAQMLCL